MATFINLPVTDANGAPQTVTLNVDDIAVVKHWPRGNGGAIIERKSSDFAVWTTMSPGDVSQQLVHAGCDLIN